MQELHRRVRKRSPTEELRLLQTVEDNVVIIQDSDSSHYIQPHDSNGISIYLPCNHGAGMVYFKHPADPTEIRKQLKKTYKSKEKYPCFQCYKRTSTPSLNENYCVMPAPKNGSPAHHHLCPKVVMKVQEIAIQGSEYLLPHIPLISDDVNDESLWKECGLVFLIKGKSEDASLESDDDSNFFLAVLDIAMMEENDFESCRMYGLMIQELLESKSITSVFETYSTFVEQAINAFLCADVSGGSYNERAHSLPGRLVQFKHHILF